MTNRAPRIVGAVLNEAIEAATFTRCMFTVPEGLRGVYSSEEWTALVTESTRLYRETWLLPVLDDVRKYFDGEVSAVRLEHDHPMLSTR